MSRARDTAGIIQYNNLTIDSNNAVGIGSSMPDTKFDINGGLRVTGIGTFENDVQIADKIVHTGDTNTAIRFPDADTFTVESGGSEAFRVHSNGQIGINTTAPVCRLQVNGGTDNTIAQLSSTDSGSYIAFDDNSTTGTTRLGAIANDLRFEVNSAERLRIDSSGVIRSIGNTSGTYENLLLTDGTSDSTTKRFGINCVHYDTGEEDFTIIHGASSSSENVIKIGGNNSATTTNDATNIRFYTAANQTTTSSSERMRIDSSGRLLVGSTSNSANIRAVFQGNSAGSTGAGVVQIARGNTFTAADTNIGNLEFTDSGANVFARIQCESDGTTAAGSDHPGRIKFLTTTDGSSSPTERLRIDNSGRLLLNSALNKSVGGVSGSLLQVEAVDQTAAIRITRNSDSAQPPFLAFSKSRGTSINSNTIVQNDDELGSIRFAGADGNDQHSHAATIAAQVDGTPGSNDMPARLVFLTASDGAVSPTERMRITSDGVINVNTTSSSPGTKFNIHNGSDAANIFAITGADKSSEYIALGIETGVPTITAGGSGSTSTSLAFRTSSSGTETVRMRIDSSGRLLVGTDSMTAHVSATFRGNSFGSGVNSTVYMMRDAANPTASQTLGVFAFSDSNEGIGAEISAQSDGDWASNDYPSRLVFSTTADGASSVTERMRIDSSGVIIAKNGAAAEIDTLSDGATVTPDLDASVNFTITLGGNRTLANPSNLTPGQSGSIFVVQDGTGGRSFNAFGSYWDFIGGTVPTFTSTASAVDRIDYIVRSSTKIHAVFTANYS